MLQVFFQGGNATLQELFQGGNATLQVLFQGGNATLQVIFLGGNATLQVVFLGGNATLLCAGGLEGSYQSRHICVCVSKYVNIYIYTHVYISIFGNKSHCDSLSLHVSIT